MQSRTEDRPAEYIRQLEISIHALLAEGDSKNSQNHQLLLTNLTKKVIA